MIKLSPTITFLRLDTPIIDIRELFDIVSHEPLNPDQNPPQVAEPKSGEAAPQQRFWPGLSGS